MQKWVALYNLLTSEWEGDILILENGGQTGSLLLLSSTNTYHHQYMNKTIVRNGHGYFHHHHNARQPRKAHLPTSRQKIADQIHRQVKAKFGSDVETVVIDGKVFQY